MAVENRVAIVTGAARGIGKETALALSREKHTVIIVDLSETGKAVAEEIIEEGGSADFYRVDVSDEEGVREFVNKVDEKFGRIDVLVNNAAIRPTKPFREMAFEDWDKVLKVNLYSTFYCCSAVLPIMERNKWGRVINLSSLASQQGSTGGHSHYAASKAGIVGLSKSLAREYAKSGITVNILAPGRIDTAGWGGELEAMRDEYAKQVPVGRIGLPEDVANVVCFLVSDKAEYITGVTLPINGGLYIS